MATRLGLKIDSPVVLRQHAQPRPNTEVAKQAWTATRARTIGLSRVSRPTRHSIHVGHFGGGFHSQEHGPRRTQRWREWPTHSWNKPWKRKHRRYQERRHQTWVNRRQTWNNEQRWWKVDAWAQEEKSGCRWNSSIKGQGRRRVEQASKSLYHAVLHCPRLHGLLGAVSLRLRRQFGQSGNSSRGSVHCRVLDDLPPPKWPILCRVGR